MKRISGLFLCLFLFNFIHAQEISNAYRITWQLNESGTAKIRNLSLLTGFNKKGYNNQPSFDEGTLYLASSWKLANNQQTDLIALNMAAREVRKITETEDQEFSPTPFHDILYFVRMDQQTKYQQLWKYDGHELKKILPDANVAYFHPISENRMATILIEDQSLVLYDINLESQEKKLIIRDAGRSLQLGKNQTLYFVHKYSPQSWYIKSYDPLTGRVKIICNTVSGSEDLFLSDNEEFWMAKDSRIYKISLEEAIGNSWKNILDLKEFGLNNIKRLCVIDDDDLILIN